MDEVPEELMTDTLERVETAQDTPPRGRRRRRSRWKSVAFLALMGALVLVATGVLPVQQYLERETQVSAAQAQLDEIEAQNDALADDVEALATDAEIERIAREQYGFVREGEIGYSVIVPETPVEDSAVAPQPVEMAQDEPGFFERIWRFMTGGDVVDDG